jgi:hypothetical protein
MGTPSSSSAFKTKLAAAGYYGLIAKEGDSRRLTERGERVTSDDAKRVLAAKREAVMSTSFGPLLHQFRGRAVDENILAARLQSDFGVPDGSSTGVARTFVETATQAGLVDDSNRFDVAAIEEFASFRPEASSSSSSKPSRAQAESVTPKPDAISKRTVDEPKADEEEVAEQPPPFRPAVQVVVNVDASNLTPTQIAELIRELQKPTA